jgi:hypothetical protein
MEIQNEAIIRLKEGLSGIQDPRRGNLRHNLIDILVIGLGAILIGEGNFEAMEDFGNEWEEWFQEFLELPNGVLDKDPFQRGCLSG